MGKLVAQYGAGAQDEGAQAVFTMNNFSAGIDNTDPSDPPTNSRLHSWLPVETQLNRMGVRLTAAPGAGRTHFYRGHYDNNANIGAASSIVNPAVTVVTDLSAADPIPALDPTDDSTIRLTYHYITNWPDNIALSTPGASFLAYDYECATLPTVTWLVCNVGGDSATASFSATDAYAAVCEDIIASSNTTQSVRQMLLPTAGRLTYAFAAWRGWSETSTVEAALQVGMFGAGADSAIVFTMVGLSPTTLYQATIDSATTVDILSTDLINWRITRTAGAATTGSICLGVGFIPSL